MGVLAIHASDAHHFELIGAGKYRFGQFIFPCFSWPWVESTVVPTVFISPETSLSAEWKTVFLAVKGKVALVAVDEAHCIPEWLILLLSMT